MLRYAALLESHELTFFKDDADDVVVDVGADEATEDALAFELALNSCILLLCEFKSRESMLRFYGFTTSVQAQQDTSGVG